MKVSKATRKALLHLLQDWKVWSNGGGVDNAIKTEAIDGGLCAVAVAYDAGNRIAKTGYASAVPYTEELPASRLSSGDGDYAATIQSRPPKLLQGSADPCSYAQ